jgi:hypothetical protein
VSWLVDDRPQSFTSLWPPDPQDRTKNLYSSSVTFQLPRNEIASKNLDLAADHTHAWCLIPDERVIAAMILFAELCVTSGTFVTLSAILFTETSWAIPSGKLLRFSGTVVARRGFCDVRRTPRPNSIALRPKRFAAGRRRYLYVVPRRSRGTFRSVARWQPSGTGPRIRGCSGLVGHFSQYCWGRSRRGHAAKIRQRLPGLSSNSVYLCDCRETLNGSFLGIAWRSYGSRRPFC